MSSNFRLGVLCFIFLVGCSGANEKTTPILYDQIIKQSFIPGKIQYLNSPFVTAGDRLYMVGHQDGSFPPLGWHIEGEMGGIWDHPIKLLDGFTAGISVHGDAELFCLSKADKFVNYPTGNAHYFIWDNEDMEIERYQFIPDAVEGIIIEFRIINKSNETKDIAFSFTGISDLRPTWLGDRTNMVDAEDEISFDEKTFSVIAKDKGNPWYAMFGSTNMGKLSSSGASCLPTENRGQGKTATLSYSLTLQRNEELTIPFFVAGSYQSEASVRSTYDLLKTQAKEKLTQKIDRYKKIRSNSNLIIADKELSNMYEWLKYNTDWLVRNVPEQGKGLCAGLPDYPWWFGADATYSLQGVLATGDHELAKNTILLLHKLSEQTNKNGRIVHEVSTNGAVYNPGNVNETAQFITLVYNYYAWTGDKELVELVFPNIKKGIKWLLEEKDPDGNHYPNGSGMMEIPGLESNLEMIDVAAYTQQALGSAAQLSSAVGDQKPIYDYEKLADELRVKINQEWWQPSENSYGDFLGTKSEATPILEAALVRSDTLKKTWAVKELKATQKQLMKYKNGQRIPFVIYRNWVVNTPLETGIADKQKALAALKQAKRYENPYGVFVTGIDRTEEPDSTVLKSRKKIFSYTGAVMTLPTGVQAVAAARYGDPEAALEYIRKLQRSFSYALPGSMYEVSPDFGMITQAWNIYGVALPIVNYFFGIQPRAFEKLIHLSPHPPKEWKDVALENVKVGDNSISVSIAQRTDHVEYQIRQSKNDWRITIDVKGAKSVMLNGKEINMKTIINNSLETQGLEMVVRIYK